MIKGIGNKLDVFDRAVDIGLIEQLRDGTYRINPASEIEQSLGFEDVAIQQAKSVCSSRLDVSISSEVIRGVHLSVPLMSSNMSTVTNGVFALKLRKLGAMGVLHRAWPTVEEYVKDFGSMRFLSDSPWLAASVGVGKGQLELAECLINNGANIIVIDIAHGYSDTVKDLAKRIKKMSPEVKVVVGNTTNLDMLYEFDGCADAIKVGIANGLVCETKNSAGCNEKQFTSVLKFKEEASRLGMPIISDGGIREPADFVKAIAAGASCVMMGSTFARCPESAGEIVNGKKIYAGMASRYVQDRWKGGLKSGTCPEGKVLELEIGENVESLLERYAGALRSGITYAGAKDVKGFQDKVKFVKV